MKKNSYILAAVFLFAVTSSLRPVYAQEKSKEEKEKELQEAIVEQKKAMIELKKAQEEQMKAQEEAQEEINKAWEVSREEVAKAMEEAREGMRNQELNKAFRIYENILPKGRIGEPLFIDPSGFNFSYHFNGDAERTTWDFSKSVKESSFSRDYVFDVEPTAKSVVMSVSGDCKAGEIRIRILMPNGKQFSEIVLDEFGNLNWRKSLSITETENKDKTGAWKFEIKSSKASGYFKIFFQTS